MICYEVWVNDQRVCVAGAEKMKSIYSSLIYAAPMGRAVFMVGADINTSESLKESPSWVNRELDVNDEIRIRIIESDTPDKPGSTQSFGTRTGPKGDEIRFCSFCGQSENEAGYLVRGLHANICSECTKLATDIVRDEA